TGARGEVYRPVAIERRPAGAVVLRLEPAFQESVTVISGVAPNIDAPPAAAALVMGQEDLDERQPQHLTDAIEGVAGLDTTEESAAAVPILRGLAGGRTLILVDGARVATERRAGSSGSFIDPFALAAVEVSRGPGSVAYGSDAFGGVIHAVPRDPVPGDPHLRYTLRASGGGAPLAAAAGEASFDALGGAALLQVHGRSGGDQRDGAGVRTPNSSYADGGAALRWVRDEESGRLRVGVAADRAEDVERPSIDADRVRASYPEDSSARLTIGYDLSPRGGWTGLELRAFAGRSRVVTDRTTVATGAIERSAVEAWDGSLRASAHRGAAGGALHAGAELVTRFGLSADSIAIGASGTRRDASIEDAARRDAALFAVWTRPLAGDVTFEAGLRGDLLRSANEGGYFGDVTVEHAAASGHAALTWRAGERLIATAQASRGFREPTLSDRFFRGTTARGFITGNPDLEPETSLQLDGSLRWTGTRASAALFVYDYTIDDLVERYREGGDFRFRNRGTADLQGIELEATAPLGRGFELQVAAAAARGEAEGDPLDEVAPPNGQATLRWSGARGFSFVRVRSVDREDDPGPLEVERPGFATADASFGWRFRPTIELIAGVENLFDRTRFASADETSALAPGRTWTIAIVGRK
ncbi:MAG TPA: TonB-dependent receptor, partial [Thermoanaerobaculia bacterium]